MLRIELQDDIVICREQSRLGICPVRVGDCLMVFVLMSDVEETVGVVIGFYWSGDSESV